MLFTPNERIVRIVYSPNSINLNNKILRASFVKFSYKTKSGKLELSTNRIEIDTVDNLRMLGRHYIQQGDAYYGLGCIKVESIQNFGGLEIAFTPDLISNPKNPSHSDIYENIAINPVNIGEAEKAEINHRRTLFVRLWKAYQDDGNLKKEDILPL